MSLTMDSKESTLPVTAEDQLNINKFARLYQKSQEINAELKRNKDQLQNLNDAADELLLLEDGEPVPMKVQVVAENLFH